MAPKKNSDTQSEEPAALPSTKNQLVMQFANKQVNIRLDDFNFLLWKQQVILMIRGHELEHYLDPDTSIPPKVVTDTAGQISLNPAYRRFKKEDSSLASWLLSTISASILPQLVGAETSAAIWATVQKLYSNLSTTKIMNLHCRLRALKKGTLTIREYTTQVKEICDLLATSGSPVAEIEQIATILNGLPTEYEPFIAAMTVSRESYTLESVTLALHDAESRILDSVRVPIGINITHFSSDKSDKGASTDKGAARPYYNSRSKDQYTGRYKGRPRVQCQLCGKLGHIVDRCWHRFDKNFKGIPSTQTSENTDDTQANVCQYVDMIEDPCYNPFVSASADPPAQVPCTSVKFPKCFHNNLTDMDGTRVIPVEPVTVENATTSNNAAGPSTTNDTVSGSTSSSREKQFSPKTHEDNAQMMTHEDNARMMTTSSATTDSQHQHDSDVHVSTEHTLAESLEDTPINEECQVEEPATNQWWVVCVAAALGSLWLVRNGAIFNKKLVSMEESMFLVKLRSLFWVRTLKKVVNFICGCEFSCEGKVVVSASLAGMES
ncbi:hypothetical protein GQ457_10G013780 [Hibiscus cannabinus]